MRTYLLQRALAGIPTLIGVTVLIFVAMRVLPGDPLAMMTSESGMTYTLTDEELQAARPAWAWTGRTTSSTSLDGDVCGQPGHARSGARSRSAS